MGGYRCFAFRNYEIGKETYDYLLPIYGKCASGTGFGKPDDPFIFDKGGKYYFVGTPGDYEEMQERCRYISEKTFNEIT
jgi:hypothetical protein